MKTSQYPYLLQNGACEHFHPGGVPGQAGEDRRAGGGGAGGLPARPPCPHGQLHLQPKRPDPQPGRSAELRRAERHEAAESLPLRREPGVAQDPGDDHSPPRPGIAGYTVKGD